ncbi:MAG: 2-C-methyl-D-erythritol 4-phosphate cytidylyltransferase, partial [Novosphingobium sp.]
MTDPAPSLSGFAAIVVAAGAGQRAGQPLPKQFALWRGKPVVRHSVEAMIAAGAEPVVVCIPEGTHALAANVLDGLAVVLVTGGATRPASVRAGLEALTKANPERVLVHDAARPVLPRAVIDRLLAALEHNAGAIPVLPVIDSLIHAEGARMGTSARREEMRRVQTPQAFSYAEILSAHRQWQGDADVGDDAQVAQAAGMEIALVEGDEALHKLTYAPDFDSALPIRVGTGYDVHRLTQGEELWLCGVKIDHSHGLSGHSDADVAIHALVDALLGAIGAGDIGTHFPPSDGLWKGARSEVFLHHAAALVAEAGYRIGNIDVTIICEAPKIGPHRAAMRARIS